MNAGGRCPWVAAALIGPPAPVAAGGLKVASPKIERQELPVQRNRMFMITTPAEGLWRGESYGSNAVPDAGPRSLATIKPAD